MDKAKEAAEEAKKTAQEAVDKSKEIASQAKEDPKKAASTFYQTGLVKAALPFINGGLSGMFATCCIQPIDMIKVRLQLAGEGVVSGLDGASRGVTRQSQSCERIEGYRGH